MCLRYSLWLVALLLVVEALGQNAIRVGEWRAHLPYSSGVTVTQDDEKVYYGTSDGLLAIRKDTNVVEFYSKVDGLNDVDIKLIKYQERNDVLVDQGRHGQHTWTWELR